MFPFTLSICMNEDKLLQAINGDRDAENQLFSDLLTRFLTITNYRVRDSALAEDIALEACQIVINKYKTQNIYTSFNAWAQGILNLHIRHCLSKEVKKDHVMVRHDYKVNNELKLGISAELEVQLLDCFKLLLLKNNRYARVINLAYQGYKTIEICKKLSISRTNYYALLSRAREILWKCLKKGEF